MTSHLGDAGSRARPWASLALGFCALALVLPAPALAWPHEGREVRPGVIYRRFSGPIDIPESGVSDQEIFVAYIDTADPRVSFVATRMDERTRRVSAFAEATGSDVAINTNYFDTSTAAQSCGLMVGEGVAWTDSFRRERRCADSIGFSGRAVSFFDSIDVLHGPAPAGITDVATGMPTVVRDGVIVDQAFIESIDYPAHMSTANPRTGVCMHEDGRTFVLIVVDGRSAGRTGMRGITFGRFARHVLGCQHAVMLDGGGSSELFVRGEPGFEGRPEGVVNRTSDGRERTVCCHLGVRIDESIAPDASVPTEDAASSMDAASDEDAGPSPDTGTRVDGGASLPMSSGACGCRAGTRGTDDGSLAKVALALLAVTLAWRSSRRSASG